MPRPQSLIFLRPCRPVQVRWIRFAVFSSQIPKGNLIHFSQCGKRIKKCGEEDKRPFEACLKMAGKNATSLTRKGISYNGSEVRIDYDDAVLVLYCGENQNSNTPLYIGQVGKSMI